MITYKSISDALDTSLHTVLRSFQRANTKTKPDGVGAKSAVKVLGKYVEMIDGEKQKYRKIKKYFENKISNKTRKRNGDHA